MFYPTLFASVYRFISNLLTFFFPIYLNSIGLNGVQIGLLAGSFTITSLLTTIPSGLTNDRIKSKYLITAGLAGYATYLFICGITNNFYFLLIASVIGGIGNNLFVISVDSLFFRLANNNKTLSKIGKFNSKIQISAGLGVILGSQLFQFISFIQLFRLMAGILFILIIISFFLPSTAIFKFNVAHYKKDLFRKEVIIFLMIIFLLAIHYGAENTTYALFIKNNLGLNKEQSGLFIGTCIILMFFWTKLAVKLIERGTSLKTIMITGLLLSGLGHILMSYPNLTTSFIFRIMHEAGDAFFFVIVYYGITKIFALSRIGGLSSSIHLINTIAATIGALFFSTIGDKFGYEYPLIISGFTTLLALFLAVQYKKLAES